MPGRTMRRTKAIKRGRKKERKKRRPKRTKIGCALLSASRQPRRTTRPAVCQDTHTHTHRSMLSWCERMDQKEICLGSDSCDGEVGSLLSRSSDLALTTNCGNCRCCVWLTWWRCWWWSSAALLTFLDWRSLADWPTSSTAEWSEFITIAARRLPDGIGLRLLPFGSTFPKPDDPASSRCGLGAVNGFTKDEGEDLILKLCEERSIGLLLRRKRPVKLDEVDDVVLLFSGEAAERLRPCAGFPTCLRTGLGL